MRTSAVLVAAALLTACGNTGTPLVDLAKGQAPPSVTGALAEGGRFDVADLQGRPSAVYFWADWCHVCIGEPLDRFQAAFSRRPPINLVSVALRSAPGRVKRVLDDGGYSFPTVLDTPGQIGRRWGVRAVPALVLLDARARVAGAFVGPVSATDFGRVLDALQAGAEIPRVQATRAA